MPQFAVTLKKTIVVHVKADDKAAAFKQASDVEQHWDGAWERAEPQIIDVEPQTEA